MLTIKPGRTVTVEELTFHVDPEGFYTFVEAASQLKALGVDSTTSLYVGSKVELMYRISAWEGVILPNGEAAPCDLPTKLKAFGQRPDLLRLIQEDIIRQEAEEIKNSEPSQDG